MDQKPTYEELESRIRQLEKTLDQMRAEDHKGSQELFEAIFESLTDAIFILGAEIPPKIINCNPAASKIFGYTRGEIIDRATDFLHVSSKELKKFQQKLYPSIAERGYFYLSDFRMKRKDETVFPTEHTVVPLLTKSGQRIGWVSIVRDITHQKLVEKALRESEERFRTAYQTIPDPVTIIRAEDGRCIDINEGFTATTGWTREDVIGKTAKDINIWHNPKDREAFIEGITKDGQIKNLEAKFRLKNNDIISGLFSAKLLMLDEKPHILSITRDISELKKAQQEKEDLEIRLRQTQKMEAIGTLAGGIAHDFNNILAAIMGYSEMALMDIAEENPARDNIKQALHAALRARDLIKQILAFSRQTGNEPKALQFHQVVNEALKLIRASLPATVTIRQSIANQTDYVLADPIQMHQVIMNLCTNAHHAMADTGGELALTLDRVELGSEMASKFPSLQSGSYLRLTVSDTGHGMDAKTIERIFDPYFTTKARGKGTGLGLAVVHGIIKNHGGAVVVKSEIGKGTTFEVLLPRATPEVQSELKETGAFQSGTENVLFVDDEKILTDLVKNMLEHLGYHVVAKTDSVEALEAFESEPDNYDLVITDMTMPKLTGDALAKKIKAIRSEIPIIICTGYSEVLNKAKAKSMGISGYLMKPISLKNLSDTIREVLEHG